VSLTAVRKTGEVEHSFFDALKLPLQANPNFSIAAITFSVLRRGSALLAPFAVAVGPCIASKNECSTSPAINYIGSAAATNLYLVRRAPSESGYEQVYYNELSLAMEIVSALR
jgi:hypothetical protein